MKSIDSPFIKTGSDWSVKQSRDLYNVAVWGGGYFGINQAGHATVNPHGHGEGIEIDLVRLLAEINDRGYSLPVLVRFPDILTQRIQSLCAAFDSAFANHQYPSRHISVYPIKVNQQRCVVERIAQASSDRVGLEAGSKTELMAVLAQSLGETGLQGTIICNGYKDREYIRLALIGQKIGKRIFIVIEQLGELDIILEESRKLGLAPNLGVRVRLSSLGRGRWQNTGGQKSKFGMTAIQLLEVVEKLRQVGCLQDLKLLHFHMGSQIARLDDIRSGMREAVRYFRELWSEGVRIDIVDVGGGIGIDYEGTASENEFSINYSLHEYASAIVDALADVCRQTSIPMPEIVTEAGRAMTAHHAVLITQVIDIENRSRIESEFELGEGEADLIRSQYELFQRLQTAVDHNALRIVIKTHELNWDHIHDQYAAGRLSLVERAKAEELYRAITARLIERLENVPGFEEIRQTLYEELADKYFCNFSVFQSLPDVWALDQVFPVMPLCRLNEAPDTRAILHDMTCDSDGQLEHYAGKDRIENSLPLHRPKVGELYALGIFLVGAYQETLGDMHNLFGDTHTVNVIMDGDTYHFEELEPGDRADELLRYLHYDPEALLRNYRSKLERVDLPQTLKKQYFEELQAGLSGYTYLED